MNILITRPLIDSEDLMGKLFSLGHKIIHIPTLKICPVKIEPIDVDPAHELGECEYGLESLALHATE